VTDGVRRPERRGTRAVESVRQRALGGAPADGAGQLAALWRVTGHIRALTRTLAVAADEGRTPLPPDRPALLQAENVWSETVPAGQRG
ncbi:hypothetical protein PBV88_49790, partial [Streptomyces sp. T21Q-yed]|nr:hypothetical protein [Streptomyces sp. T21Q-yed]